MIKTTGVLQETGAKVLTRFRVEFSSPLGVLWLTSNGQALTAIALPKDKDAESSPLQPAPIAAQDPILSRTIQQLEEYFAGTRVTFDLPLDPQGTEHQRKVWTALYDIPYGATISYGELASRIGRPTAARAVGAANGQNPIPIIIPCHRVIGANGRLTGYRGGLAVKEWLLDHEQTHNHGDKRAIPGLFPNNI